MSDLIISRLGAGVTAGKVATTIDDPDFPGEFVASWEDPTGVSVEDVQDIIGALVADGSGIDAVYDDAGNLVTIQLGPITVNAQTGTSYTLVLADAPKGVTMSNAAASTLTVPPNSSVAFPVGTRIPGMQIGAGQVTITPGVGVTVHATPGLKVAAQYGAFELWKIDTDEWVAYGRLSA